MANGSNTRTVQKVYETFGSMDTERSREAGMQSLLGLYSEDIIWEVPQMDNVRFSGKRRGIEGVKEFFSTMMEDLEFLELEPQEYIADGDNVVTLGRYSWRVRSTGREFSSAFAHVCTVRDGKIVRFREYMDTAAEVKAHRKRDDRPGR